MLLSDTLRLTPRQRRCLDALDRANGRVVPRTVMAEAMYPPPADEPEDFGLLLKVTICQIRKIMRAAGADRRIATEWGSGYRLILPGEAAA